MANYPSDGVNYRRQRRPSTPSANRYLPDLEARSANRSDPPPGVGAAGGRGVNSGSRSAAQRSREMGSKMYGLFHRAATADGADKSGLTALTYPVMANFAVDSAMAVALANTLFFAAASGESKSRVALYLLITIAPEVPGHLLAWLVSEENTHLCGQLVFVDGGSDAVIRGDSTW